MEEVSLKAYAKINIGLDITGKRKDGYHLLESCMQTIDLFDVVTLAKDETVDTIKIISDLPAGLKEKDNIAYKAADLIKKEFGIRSGITIDIQKNIPMAAGLAGGSADAAAALKGMNELFGLGLDTDELSGFAVKLGADVPFCLRKGLWLCKGIGEILTPLPALDGLCALIVKPKEDISTKWCYEEFDRLKEVSHPDMSALVSAIRDGDIKGVCAAAKNVLEQASCPHYPEIEKIKQSLIINGADMALMSGSGSTVFGLFGSKDRAKEAFLSIKEQRDIRHAFLADLVYPKKSLKNMAKAGQDK